MATLEITADQQAFIQALRAEIAEQIVGEYGHVREEDVVQFLIDDFRDDRASDLDFDRSAIAYSDSPVEEPASPASGQTVSFEESAVHPSDDTDATDSDADEESPLEDGDEDEEGETLAFDPGEHTVEEIEAHVETLDGPGAIPELEAMRLAEQDGKNRTTALDVITDALDERDESATDGPETNGENADDGSETSGEEDDDDSSETGSEEDRDDDSSETGSDGDADDDSMLNEMMALLDTHDDKWGESSAADYRYAVDLPDGSTENVQTKDDVRALLFKHYR